MTIQLHYIMITMMITNIAIITSQLRFAGLDLILLTSN